MLERIKGICGIGYRRIFDIFSPTVVVFVVGNWKSGHNVFPVLGFLVSCFLETRVGYCDLFVFKDDRFSFLIVFVPHLL